MTQTLVRPEQAAVVRLPIADLRPNPRNPRTINRQALDRLKVSIKTYGFAQPVLWNKRTGFLVAGHQRVAAAKELGYTDIPVVVVDYDDATQHGATIAFNGDYGLWDEPALRDLIFELRAEDYDLDTLALPNFQLDSILQGGAYDSLSLDGSAPAAALGEGTLAVQPGLAGNTPPSGATSDDSVEDAAGGGESATADSRTPAPWASKLTVTQRARWGDIWTCGLQTICVGDCRDAETLARLFGGEMMDLVVTSPPYADRRKYDDESSPFRPIPPEQYIAWYEDVAGAIHDHLAPHGSYLLNIKPHCEHGQRLLYVSELLLAHVREWGWRFIDEFAWVHPGVPGAWPNRFKNGWEPVYHFSKGKDIIFRPQAVALASDETFRYDPARARSESGSGFMSHRGEGQSKKEEGLARPGNVVQTASGASVVTGQHPAEYPVALPEFFISAFSDPDMRVFDPFLGAASTLVAAQRLGRRGFGCEISPAYCDLALARLEDETGLPACKEER